MNNQLQVTNSLWCASSLFLLAIGVYKNEVFLCSASNDRAPNMIYIMLIQLFFVLGIEYVSVFLWDFDPAKVISMC